MHNVIQNLLCVFVLVAITAPAWGRDLPCDSEQWLDAEKSMVITDLSVVNSSQAEGNGDWSFGRAMVGALGTSDNLGTRTYNWIDQFGKVRNLNGFNVVRRTPGGLLENWPRRGPAGSNVLAGKDLDLTRSPFRLLAIVFRPDLAGADKPAGEGRFVYGATNPQFGTKNLTVIFEFNLPTDIVFANGEQTTPAWWNRQIAELSTMSFGASYNQRLARLTNLFAKPTTGTSHISQVRTNDQYFGRGWDLREFHRDPDTMELIQRPVAQTPDTSLNTRGRSDLVAWVKENRDAILAGNFKVPERFLGGSSFLEDDVFAWFLGNRELDPQVRREFGMNTCNGCHGRETRTRFLHIEPRLAPDEAKLSRYLTNKMVQRARNLERQVCGN